MKTIKCSTVKIDITDLQGHIVTFTVPAYTVPEIEFCHRVEKLLDTYTAASKANGDQVSLGDFVLWMITLAANDPKEITIKGD
jgi:hypothetical protein